MSTFLTRHLLVSEHGNFQQVNEQQALNEAIFNWASSNEHGRGLILSTHLGVPFERVVDSYSLATLKIKWREFALVGRFVGRWRRGE